MKIVTSSCDNRMEGIWIRIRRFKHDILIRAITDVDRISITKWNRQDKSSILMGDVNFMHESYDERFRATLFFEKVTGLAS